MFTCPRGGLEVIQRFGGFLIVNGLIYPLQAFGDLLAIFPAAEVQGMANQMHDTGLHRGIREGCVDGIREALEPVNDGDQDVLQPSVFEIVHN